MGQISFNGKHFTFRKLAVSYHAATEVVTHHSRNIYIPIVGKPRAGTSVYVGHDGIIKPALFFVFRTISSMHSIFLLSVRVSLSGRVPG